MNFLLSVNIDNVNRKRGISGKMTFSFHFNHLKINNKKCTGHWSGGNVARLSRQKTIKQCAWTPNYHFLIVRGKILWWMRFLLPTRRIGDRRWVPYSAIFLVPAKETIWKSTHSLNRGTCYQKVPNLPEICNSSTDVIPEYRPQPPQLKLRIPFPFHIWSFQISPPPLPRSGISHI